ncbi:MAG: Ig-like domain-containing protein, partial [Caldilineaceae bacterium]
GIDAVAYGGGSNGAVKVAGTCTGVSATNGLNQTGYISTGLSLSGGYTITNWLAAADPDTYPTTLDADGAGRVLYITGTLPVTVTGLIITGGYWDVIENSLVPGGGIYAAASSVAIIDSQILSNTAFSSPLVEPLGGGLYHAAGTLVLSNLEVGYNAATGTYRGRGGALYSAGESVTVVDSTFLNNTSDAKGGALYTTGALIVTDSTFTGNNSSNDDGGALFHNGSSGIISGSTFRQNRSEFTGGALSLDGDEFTIQNSLFEENSAYYDGGAIAKWGGTLHISDSIIRQNTVDVYTGGGIVNSAGSMILESSAIVSNTAPLVGGGILNGYDNGAPASLTLINSTVSGNQVTTATVDTYYGGGGIGHWTDDSSSLTIRYSTIANNSAPNLDGRDGLYVNGVVTVTGSIIAGNGTQNCAGNSATYTSEGYNLEDVDTCGFDTTGDQPNTDPLLGTLAEEGDTFIYIPAKSSPAVDIIPVGAAGCAVTYATDQRGVARPQNLYCDSGSVEITNQTPTAGDDSYSTGADEALTILAVGVLANDSDPDGDSLSALLSAPPTNGSLALNSDGSFVYTPTVGFAGVDRFTYAASDGNLRASAEVTIAVGSATVPDIPLSGPAWNLFGWPLQASYAISEGLASIDGSYATVYGYEPDDGSDPWKVYDTSLPGVLNDLTRFEFGHGYWISTTQSVTVTLSTLGSSRLADRFDGSIPPPPATLWGRVAAVSGGDITVTIDGLVCGRGIVMDGWYRVHVATDAERPGCGASGRTVTVQAGDVTRSLAWP